MTATATERNTDFAGVVPSKGTLSAAANKLFLKGTIVQIDSAGRATPGANANGFLAAGKASATFYNRTSDPSGGGADAIKVEVEYGLFGWNVDGADPEPGETVWVVDNQTVSADSSSGTRGVAGVCLETRLNQAGVKQCYTLMGPHWAELFSDDSALGTAVTTAQSDIEDLQASAVLWESPNLVPLLRLSTGAAVPAFSNGVADGFELTGSEALGLRINDDSTTVFTTTISLPEDLDDGEDLVIKILGARVGSSDTADVALTVGAFFHTVGAAYTADSDAGGESSSFVAATTVISEETLTILAADVPATPCDLTLTFQVTSELDADDLLITSIKATGLKALG